MARLRLLVFASFRLVFVPLTEPFPMSHQLPSSSHGEAVCTPQGRGRGPATRARAARGEQVLRGALDAMPRAARADDRRARHPPNIAAPLDERSAGHTDHAPRASSRVGAIESTAATCCRATTHSSTCSWLSSRRRLRRPSRSTKTVRCFTVQPATTAASLGYSPASRIAPNASTTGFTLCAHERVGASAMRRESADLAAALESGHVPSP